ncbi:AtzE family amidohydrolase [Methylobacterium bullatum]|uniref:1-carboxybiuret hydrolase subunit AtzE n=1 Tax=Methylobacterium bullatum TaxID=570505 RepID=A0AAV4Z888_9HYPH|nr:AtzE family amidohydrolase [Methylobacterium bullatum]MBD8902007.1 Asp-tRNA(Asn)/Glu-tRNA(Gln) amidotransferase GatCAB subunit A [Methylobacterium bullatum]GJD40032.1 1-carboxybiuret hydrolase subunit AtzE [Methylobacterium bullatum]
MTDPSTMHAADIAGSVRDGAISARLVVEAVLARIARVDTAVNAFTDVLPERALTRADAVDAARARGEALGPLAGVPFAVKNLIDIAGLPTRAGSKINRDLAPARRDGALVRRLEAAGAILVGGLNMGEYAYDFTGENVHDGATRNPHDLGRMSGGSSGGSGGAIGAGLVPLALGSDTNGSIRVPSAFCGCFGLKPTYGRLTRAGSFPFVGSLDHLGPMARSVTDLALSYDAMQGPDPDDPVATTRAPDPAMPSLDDGIGDLRIAMAGGYFARGGDNEAFMAVETLAASLGCGRRVEIPEAARARAAAYLITAAEGAALHLDRLRTRAADFDPAVRDRLIAGAMIPAPFVERAQRFRRWYRAAMLDLFREVDIILAPSTPCRAPKSGQVTFELDGVTLPVRANIGVFTQPISFIGLPVVAVPVRVDDGLPLGVQVIAAPWREDLALRVARHLERNGVVSAPHAIL